jgi:anti-sigma factor RsiW
MKNYCSSVSKLLEKYSDQEVTEEERSLVEGHLQDCTACRDALHSMERFRNLIKSPVEEAVERENFPWVWQKIERGIQLNKRPTWWESLRDWLDITPLFRKRILIPAAAAVIFLIITAPFLFEKITSYPDRSVVEYVESETCNVMVYESDNAQMTVIWLFEGPEEEEESFTS